MSYAATNTRLLDINAIILRAAQSAGVLSLQQDTSSTQWAKIGAWGRDALEVFTKSLQAQGVLERAVELYPLPIVAGTNPYTLPADTINVVDTAMFFATGETTETPVLPMSRDDYQITADKTSTGNPARYYLARGQAVQLYLDLVPSSSGTLRLQRIKAFADSSSGSDNVDLDSYWMDACIARLAYDIAKASGISVERCLLLRTDATDAMKQALSFAKSDQPSRLVLNHPTPWSR